MKILFFEQIRNFSALDERDCQAVSLFAHWGQFGRETRDWPCRWGRSTPFPHAYRENRPIFQNKGFPSNQCWIMCIWSLQYHWGPPEHPRDTSHTFSASCCRLPIRPVSVSMGMLSKTGRTHSGGGGGWAVFCTTLAPLLQVRRLAL